MKNENEMMKRTTERDLREHKNASWLGGGQLAVPTTEASKTIELISVTSAKQEEGNTSSMKGKGVTPMSPRQNRHHKSFASIACLSLLAISLLAGTASANTFQQDERARQSYFWQTADQRPDNFNTPSQRSRKVEEETPNTTRKAQFNAVRGAEYQTLSFTRGGSFSPQVRTVRGTAIRRH